MRATHSLRQWGGLLAACAALDALTLLGVATASVVVAPCVLLTMICNGIRIAAIVAFRRHGHEPSIVVRSPEPWVIGVIGVETLFGFGVLVLLRFGLIDPAPLVVLAILLAAARAIAIWTWMRDVADGIELADQPRRFALGAGALGLGIVGLIGALAIGGLIGAGASIAIKASVWVLMVGSALVAAFGHVLALLAIGRVAESIPLLCIQTRSAFAAVERARSTGRTPTAPAAVDDPIPLADSPPASEVDDDPIPLAGEDGDPFAPIDRGERLD